MLKVNRSPAGNYDGHAGELESSLSLDGGGFFFILNVAPIATGVSSGSTC